MHPTSTPVFNKTTRNHRQPLSDVFTNQEGRELQANGEQMETTARHPSLSHPEQGQRFIQTNPEAPLAQNIFVTNTSSSQHNDNLHKQKIAFEMSLSRTAADDIASHVFPRLSKAPKDETDTISTLRPITPEDARQALAEQERDEKLGEATQRIRSALRGQKKNDPLNIAVDRMLDSILNS